MKNKPTQYSGTTTQTTTEFDTDELEEIFDELNDPKTTEAVIQGRKDYKQGKIINYDDIKK